MLVFEKQYGIVATNRSAQKAAEIERCRRHYHAQPRHVRENHFAGLAVVKPSPCKIAADGNPDHSRRLERAIGAPPHHGEFIAKLHHRWPDVIEELNLGDRLHASRGHSDGAPHDARFRNRSVEHTSGPKSPLQIHSGLENSALAFHTVQIVFVAAIRDVLAKYYNPFVARHFVGQRGGHAFHHGLRIARELRRGFKLRRSRIDVWRVYVFEHTQLRRWPGLKGLVGRFPDL